MPSHVGLEFWAAQPSKLKLSPNDGSRWTKELNSAARTCLTVEYCTGTAGFSYKNSSCATKVHTGLLGHQEDALPAVAVLLFEE